MRIFGPMRDEVTGGWRKLYELYSSLSLSVAFSSRAKYADRATATCRRNLVPTFVDRGVSRGQRGRSHTVVNLSFLDQNRYFFFK
jgi:hypothetical protein